jgi:hypothetical protein
MLDDRSLRGSNQSRPSNLHKENAPKDSPHIRLVREEAFDIRLGGSGAGALRARREPGTHEEVPEEEAPDDNVTCCTHGACEPERWEEVAAYERQGVLTAERQERGKERTLTLKKS